ncbi:CD74 molecule, major histocompatibility complex, class II invariant chain b [Centropristis striata]|uniref:CD74 molecule, major histocompatibility complex, class II invariant chain b n=1 Tax=Centropristis striata TaxID=184440 RepID=UPI0027DF14D8|nr:CD74 molecule, major histocompatibility complex, class II invariant chain b [Centropristis striata]
MADPETPNQPLLAAPNQQGGRSSRAYKVAGITLLACVLIVGQAMIAYFLLSQRGDIRTLKEQNDDLKSELTKGRSVAVPMKMHMPMQALPELMVASMDEDTSTAGGEDKPVPVQLTECQKEAAGLEPVQFPNFRPECDERGLYRSQQCVLQHCWCVNPASGREVPGTLTNGKANCMASVSMGGMSKVFAA